MEKLEKVIVENGITYVLGEDDSKRCNLSTFTIPHISAIIVINTTLV